jgi:hypothetical protein
MEHYGFTTDREVYRFRMESREHHRPTADQVVATKFPYEAPEHPGIPSMAEIEKGMKENIIAQPGGLFEVCRVGKCAVKRGNDWLILQVRLYTFRWAVINYLQEAENLLFLEKHSRVRTPKLYAAFSQPRKPFDVHYLVTEFIEGEIFDEAKWLALDDDARETICLKLSEQFQRLRDVPAEGYYGRVYHQSLGATTTPLSSIKEPCVVHTTLTTTAPQLCMLLLSCAQQILSAIFPIFFPM